MKKISEFILDNPGKEIFLGIDDILTTQDMDEYQNETSSGLNGRDLIDDYFDDIMVPVAHKSGNPELETDVPISGTRYVYMEFGGDYDKALQSILIQVRP